MSKISLMAGASKFAHFAGFSRPGARAEEGDDQEPKGKKGRAADDDDDGDEVGQPKGKKGRAAADDDDDGDEPKGKKGRASADDDDDDNGDEDDQPKAKKGRAASDEDDEDGDEPKGKKGRAAEDDDDDRDEMSGKSATASARRRERARCAAIFAHPVAAANTQLACSLAFETTMTRQEAIAVMKGQSDRSSDDQSTRNRHSRADRGGRNVRLGSDGGPSDGKQAVKAGWDTAFNKAGVKPR